MSIRARTLAPAVLLTLGVVPVACGGGAPPPAAPAAPAPSASAAIAAPALPPDLSEVPEPAEVVALARWKSPQASLDTIKAWTGLPISTAQILQDVLSDRKLAESVLATASVDAVVALDPEATDREWQPLGAVSLGLRSWDDAKKLAQGRGGTEVKPGVLRIGPQHHGKKRHRGEPTCLVAAAAGDAPARLVCGERDKDLDALAPWLTRTLPRRPALASDLHAEVRFVPLEHRYGPMLRQYAQLAANVAPSQVQIGEPTFDRAVTEGVQSLVDETLALSTDLDQLAIDATLAPEGGDATMAVRLRGATSWIAQTVKERADRKEGPPAAFSRLPIDAAVAGWSRGPDAKRTAGIRDLLARLGSGFLAHEGVAEADRKVVAELLDALQQMEASSVAATGTLDSVARAGILAPKGAPKDAVPGKLRASLADLGWRLYGFDGPPDKIVAALKDLAAVYARPNVRRSLEKTIGGQVGKHLPTVKTSAAPKGLPAGSFELDVAIDAEALEAKPAEVVESGKGKAKPAAKRAPSLPPVHVYVIVVPDGAQTWLASGPDRATLLTHLAAAKSGAPDAGTLASRAGLDPIRAAGLSSGAFLSVSGFAPLLRRAMAESGKPVDVDRLLNGIPRQGTTPIFLTSRSTSDGGLTSTLELRVPKLAIDEAVALVLGAMAQAGMKP